jgi:hypothetical protein
MADFVKNLFGGQKPVPAAVAGDAGNTRAAMLPHPSHS